MKIEIDFRMANLLVQETAKLGLSFAERMLYLYLGNMVQYGRNTITDKYIAEKVGTNERQVRRLKESLKAKGFIDWTTSKEKGHRFSHPCTYTVKKEVEEIEKKEDIFQELFIE